MPSYYCILCKNFCILLEEPWICCCRKFGSSTDASTRMISEAQDRLFVCVTFVLSAGTFTSYCSSFNEPLGILWDSYQLCYGSFYWLWAGRLMVLFVLYVRCCFRASSSSTACTLALDTSFLVSAYIKRKMLLRISVYCLRHYLSRDIVPHLRDVILEHLFLSSSWREVTRTRSSYRS